MPDDKNLAIINQKNLINGMRQKLADSKHLHPHAMISQRLKIIIERAKLGQLITE